MSDKRPECYGNLESVFPMGKDGLRCSPDKCLGCVHKVRCLRAALEGEGGLSVQEEKLERRWESGTISFFERWSRKKALHTRRRKK